MSERPLPFRLLTRDQEEALVSEFRLAGRPSWQLDECFPTIKGFGVELSPGPFRWAEFVDSGEPWPETAKPHRWTCAMSGREYFWPSREAWEEHRANSSWVTVSDDSTNVTVVANTQDEHPYRELHEAMGRLIAERLNLQWRTGIVVMPPVRSPFVGPSIIAGSGRSLSCFDSAPIDNPVRPYPGAPAQEDRE